MESRKIEVTEADKLNAMYSLAVDLVMGFVITKEGDVVANRKYLLEKDGKPKIF